MSAVDFKQQLKRQLRFLENSCKVYDEGHVDEAVRIATVIRVLVHDTQRSTSLLSHLNALNANIVTSNRVPANAVLFSSSLTTIQMNFESDGQGNMTHEVMQLPAGAEAIHGVLSVFNWWNEPIMKTLEGVYTRKDIVLWAANKDGGAHVDPTLPPMYVNLVKGKVQSGIATDAPEGQIGFYVEIQLSGTPRKEDHMLPNAHFSDLRQMALEILNSPEILQLAAD